MTHEAKNSKVALIERIEGIVAESYEDGTARLALNPSGQVYGTVVSGSFATMNDIARQDDLYSRLRQSLTAQDLQKLLFVFTVTPQEDAIIERNAKAGGESPASTARFKKKAAARSTASSKKALPRKRA